MSADVCELMCVQGISDHMHQLRLLWVMMLCTLLMAAPSCLAQILLPQSAHTLKLPDLDTLLAVPPALLGVTLVQVLMCSPECADTQSHSSDIAHDVQHLQKLGTSLVAGPRRRVCRQRFRQLKTMSQCGCCWRHMHTGDGCCSTDCQR
jgi:hypothetical protein